MKTNSSFTNNILNLNPPLSQKQIQICRYAQQFVTANNPSSEQALKKSKWEDIYTLISHPTIDNNIRIVCCSTLKWLIYHKNFVHDPIDIFRCLCQFYFKNLDPNQDPTAPVGKPQQLAQIVIKAIPATYLRQQNKQFLIEQLLKLLYVQIEKSPRILKIITIIVQQIQIDRINNQKLVGELLLFLENITKLQNQSINLSLKLLIIKEIIILIQIILDLVNNQNQLQANYVEQFLTNSTLAKKILYSIISQASNGKQIITNNQQVNQIKFAAMSLYSSIWVYSLDEPLFLLCLSSLLTSPTQLVDNQANIIEKVVVMLQRSIGNQAYYSYFHKNHQHISVTLFSFLKPKQSYLEKLETEPEYFVDIMQDFCLLQQEQLFQARVGSLLASLCLYIDGYMSFVGSLCIAMIKKFSGSIHLLPGVDQYINTINSLWVCSEQQKVSTCVLVLSSISDQFQKRDDLSAPLRQQLIFMNPMFKFPQCKIPPYLICRFMLLYAFYAYPKCLDVFLPYKNTKPVYQAQLQSCYRIMIRYYNRYKECKKYVDQIGHIIIVTDHLTPLLQNSIMTGQMSNKLQFQILQKLVIWMQKQIINYNHIKCNKYANLISILIDRMVVEDQKVTQDAVFAYLQPFFKLVTTKQGSDSQQFVIQICVAFIKKFPSLQQSPERLLILVEMGFKIVQRNNGILNTCLDLFYQLTKYLPKQLVQSLMQIYLGCLQSQDRQKDYWQCYYALENCLIRLYQLKAPIPNINVHNILQKVHHYDNQILKIKAYMLIYSIIMADPCNRQNPQQYISGNHLPQKIPPYENKPYCLYLLNIGQYLQMNIQYSKWYLSLVLKLMRNQKDINKLILKYEQQVYCGEQDNQTVINAYTCSRKLLHPFILKNIDIYNQFRKFWWKFPNRQKIMYLLDKPTLDYITELCTQTTINHKVRKIYKIKSQQVTQVNKQNSMQDSQIQNRNKDTTQMI